VVEGTPLLRVQTGNRLEGSNPFLSATYTKSSNLNDLCSRKFFGSRALAQCSACPPEPGDAAHNGHQRNDN
jgi:hypothetical protein